MRATGPTMLMGSLAFFASWVPLQPAESDDLSGVDTQRLGAETRLGIEMVAVGSRYLVTPYGSPQLANAGLLADFSRAAPSWTLPGYGGGNAPPVARAVANPGVAATAEHTAGDLFLAILVGIGLIAYQLCRKHRLLRTHPFSA